MPATLNLEQAADLLFTTPDTVSECIARRGLPAVKIGRAWVLVEADVIDWLRSQYPRETPCASTPEEPKASYGLTSQSTASALSAALAPRKDARRRNTPQRLRAISGGQSGSAKPPA